MVSFSKFVRVLTNLSDRFLIDLYINIKLPLDALYARLNDIFSMHFENNNFQS